MWVRMLEYAAQFGCHPHEVPAVPLTWWSRWTFWEKTKQARQAHDHLLRRRENETLSEAEMDLLAWSRLVDGERS